MCLKYNIFRDSRATSSKSNESNECTPDQKKANSSKNSKTSQNSNNSARRSNSQDIKNNNVEEHLQHLSLENKHREYSSTETSKLEYMEQRKSTEKKAQNKNEVHRNSRVNGEHGKDTTEKESEEKRTERKTNKSGYIVKSCIKFRINRISVLDFTEKLNFIEDNQPIETDEWIVFLQKTIQEVINGEMGTLMQPGQTNIIVSPLRNSNANSKVLSFVARLLSIPFVIKGTSEDTLSQIKKVRNQKYVYMKFDSIGFVSGVPGGETGAEFSVRFKIITSRLQRVFFFGEFPIARQFPVACCRGKLQEPLGIKRGGFPSARIHVFINIAPGSS